jgi:2-oxoglutarate/2-oxoacid ferredoxin oxidoreductase subunit alpha
VPLVVTLYQRGSPSTGMPTRSEQGDLQSVIHAGHGEFPRIVLASGDIQEAFDDAAQAFNYAERYQMLVIHLLDKALASTTQTVPPFDVEAIRIERGEIYTSAHDEPRHGAYARFARRHPACLRERSWDSQAACTGSPAASTPCTVG